jgi:hypothetical protein
MHMISAVAASTPTAWLYGVGSVVIGGAVVPFLLSVVPDAVALLVQRRRWQLLAGLVAATAAAIASLRWTMSLAMSTPTSYMVDWPQFVGLLFGVGMVVALWHGLPRVMRSILRRRREDRERVAPAPVIVEHSPKAPANAPLAPAPLLVAVVGPRFATEAIVLAD